MEIIVYTIHSEIASARKLGFPVHTYLFDSVDNYDDKIVISYGNSSLAYKPEPLKVKGSIKVGDLIIPQYDFKPEKV